MQTLLNALLAYFQAAAACSYKALDLIINLNEENLFIFGAVLPHFLFLQVFGRLLHLVIKNEKQETIKISCCSG